MIRLEGVDAGYGGGLVLRGVDIVAAQDRVTCIVGPNGAGKSTVLRVAAGLLSPVAGRVFLGEQQIGGLSPAQVLARGAVLVPQHDGLFPRMTVEENILMGAYPIRRHRRLVRERMERVRELYPIVRERAHAAAGLLSGGQRRLVEFARATMIDPQVIMLDEPSIGLDPASLAMVGDSIRQVVAGGTTVVMVEQNVRFGLGIADDAVVMEGGRVAMQGAASAVLEAPEIREIFLGGHAHRSEGGAA